MALRTFTKFGYESLTSVHLAVTSGKFSCKRLLSTKYTFYRPLATSWDQSNGNGRWKNFPECHQVRLYVYGTRCFSCQRSKQTVSQSSSWLSGIAVKSLGVNGGSKNEMGRNISCYHPLSKHCSPLCSKETETKSSSQNTLRMEKSPDLGFSENILTVPNVLTVTRMTLSPVLGYLVLQQSFLAACGIFIVAGTTDLLDGYIARKYPSQTSALGSFLDPLADKLLASILFVTLTIVDLIPVWLTVMVIMRDILLMGGGFYVRYISLPPPITFKGYFDISNVTAQLKPMFISKVNTALQLGLVTVTLAAPVFNYVDHTALHALWYLTACSTTVTGLAYIFAKDTFRLIKQNKKDKA